MTDLAALVVRMQADNSAYIKALDQSTQRLNRFQKEQSEILNGIDEQFKDIGAGIAGAFAVDKIIEFTAGAIEAQAALSKFAQEAGVSAQEISSLQIAFAASGVSTDELQVGFKKLNQAISDASGNPTSKAALAFKALGISVTDSNGNLKSVSQILPEVADAYSKAADGPNKVAITTALLGRASLALIPQLNAGSQALEDAKQAAIDCGAALSNEAAEKAEQLEKQFVSLSATSKAQLQNAISAQLTPALLAMADGFGNAKDRGAAFQVIATEIVSGIKLIATVGLEVARTFENIGSGIGNLAAQAANVFHPTLVAQIQKDFEDETAARDKRFADAESALWNTAADAQVAAAQRGADDSAKAQEAQKQSQLASIAQLQKASEGVTKLETYATSLKEQVAAFDQGAEAATREKLATGELGDALKTAAAAGAAAANAAGPSRDALLEVASAAQKAAGEIRAYAAALQIKKDTKTADAEIESLVKQADTYGKSESAAFQYKISTGELGAALDRLAKSGHDLRPALEAAFNLEITQKDKKSIDEINDSVLQLSGSLVKAAKNQFDLQNASLRDNIQRTNDPNAAADLAAIDNKEKLVLAQAQFNELAEQSSQIESAFALQEAQINAAVVAGTKTTLAAQQEVAAARTAELQQLQGILGQQQQIAADNATSLPKLTQQVNATKAQLTGLAASADSISIEIRNDLQHAFADSLLEAETGAKSFKAAFSDMVKSIEKDLLTLANKNLAESLFGTGGAGSGFASGLASLFGGGGGGGLSGLFGGTSGIGAAASAASSSGSNIAASLGTISIPGFATGGSFGPGKLAIVGEQGPELIYSGASNTNVIANQSIGSKAVNVTNHFTIQSQGGQISRASQMQTAAAAARSLASANRRNNQ